MSEMMGPLTTSIGALLVACGLVAATANAVATPRLLGAHVCLLGIVMLVLRHESDGSSWILAALLPAVGLALLLASGAAARAGETESSNE